MINFWLFGTLKRQLKRSMFGNAVEVLTAVSIILSPIHLDEFVSVFDEWRCRLLECIGLQRQRADLLA
jgi:hypothetical protein